MTANLLRWVLYHQNQMTYYNEFDPKTAAWLRELIKQGLIADGVVDERSITEVTAGDLQGYTQCHFFAGIGGWSLALRLAGWPDSRPVWTGSCPCQPYSNAGKGEGDADPRNLWPHLFQLIRECRPNVCFGEQVESAVGHGWLDGISADLEGENYACGSAVLGAHSVGAPHIRQRLYWVADDSNPERHQQSREESCSREIGRMGREFKPVAWNEPWQSALSRFRVVGDGLPRSVGRSDAARNAIVPKVAAEFIQAFEECIS